MKKKYKCFWLVALLFIVLASVVALSYLLRPVSTSRKNVCGFYAEKENTLDMVYIGGSACYRYWEPLEAWKQYGYTSYNFATDAIPPQVIEYIVKEVLKTQTPDLFVVELRPFQYGDLVNEEFNVVNMEHVAPYRNVSDNMKYSHNRMKMIHNTAPEEDREWTYQFDLAKYHSLLINFFSVENWKRIDNKEELCNKGFWGSGEIGPFEWTDYSDCKLRQPLDEKLDVILKQLLEYCNSEGLKVLFVVPPYQINEEDQKKYNYMKDVIEDNGQIFLNVNDYYQEIGFNEQTDFYNMNHTNLWGAEKYTGFLSGYIKDNYSMPDHRLDEKYSNWNYCYEQWEEDIKEVGEQLKKNLNENFSE